MPHVWAADPTTRELHKLMHRCREEITYSSLFKDEPRLLIAHEVYDVLTLSLVIEDDLVKARPDIAAITTEFVREVLSLYPYELMHNRLSIPQNFSLLYRQLDDHLVTTGDHQIAHRIRDLEETDHALTKGAVTWLN